MYQNIILFILLVAYTNGYSQSFESGLLAAEHKIYLAHTDSQKANLINDKINFYIRHDSISIATFNEVKRLDYKFLGLKDQPSFFWNASLIAYLNNEIDYALYYYNNYRFFNDSSKESLLLEFLIASKYDTAIAAKNLLILTDSNYNFNSLKCMNNLISYHRKNKMAYVIASAIIPGSGSMLNGYSLKGINSLAVNSALFYGIYALFNKNLYINALFWGIGAGFKFYVGNLRLTSHLFDQREQHKKGALSFECECTLQKILKDYPLNFK